MPAESTKPVTGKEALARVLRRAGEPLKTKVLVERALKVKGIRLAGKTPDHTLAAMLAVENKKADGLFVRTAPRHVRPARAMSHEDEVWALVREAAGTSRSSRALARRDVQETLDEIRRLAFPDASGRAASYEELAALGLGLRRLPPWSPTASGSAPRA